MKTDNTKLNIFTLFAVALIILGCSAKQSDKEQIKKDSILVEETNSLENFDAFYKKFYNDSLFQISRIIFPLKGFNTAEYDHELGDKNPPYFWKKEDWVILETLPKDSLRVVENDSDYTYYRKIAKQKDSSILEKISIKDGGFIEERVFKLIKNKWYLVYYSYKDF